MINGSCQELVNKSTYDGGLMGGGVTSFYDYSITRNVFTMLLTCLILFLAFRAAGSSQTEKARLQRTPEFPRAFYTFIRDDVAISGHWP
ncbi:MAG: hypothetical protein R2778_09455 [Saprospiraceae bacterium]